MFFFLFKNVTFLCAGLCFKKQENQNGMILDFIEV